METANLVTIFVSCLIISLTRYALYTSFGRPSEGLIDPFDNHED